MYIGTKLSIVKLNLKNIGTRWQGVKSENRHCIKSVNESGELEGALVGEMPKVEHI